MSPRERRGDRPRSGEHASQQELVRLEKGGARGPGSPREAAPCSSCIELAAAGVDATRRQREVPDRGAFTVFDSGNGELWRCERCGTIYRFHHVYEYDPQTGEVGLVRTGPVEAPAAD